MLQDQFIFENADGYPAAIIIRYGRTVILNLQIRQSAPHNNAPFKMNFKIVAPSACHYTQGTSVSNSETFES